MYRFANHSSHPLQGLGAVLQLFHLIFKWVFPFCNAINYQLSIINYQLSTINYQLSIINCLPQTIPYRIFVFAI